MKHLIYLFFFIYLWFITNNCNLRFQIFIIKTIRRFKKWERGGSRYGGATGRVPFQPSPLKFSQWNTHIITLRWISIVNQNIIMQPHFNHKIKQSGDNQRINIKKAVNFQQSLQKQSCLFAWAPLLRQNNLRRPQTVNNKFVILFQD